MKRLTTDTNFRHFAMSTLAVTALMTLLFMDAGSITVFANQPDFDNVTAPIIGLLNSLLTPAIALVGAVGTLYCVFLGVKFAKAEEPQEREKAKAHLRNAIIGFVLIFVLIVALRQALPILQDWMSANTQ